MPPCLAFIGTIKTISRTHHDEVTCRCLLLYSFLFESKTSPVFDIITTVFCYIVTIQHLFT